MVCNTLNSFDPLMITEALKLTTARLKKDTLQKVPTDRLHM